MIPRLYGGDSPKIKLRNKLNDFVKVERKHAVKLSPGEEFSLYITRLFNKVYSESQGACGDMMGVSSNTFSEYVNALQDKGYIKIHTKVDGRSKWYEQLMDPKDDWSGIPKSFVRDEYIGWSGKNAQSEHPITMQIDHP